MTTSITTSIATILALSPYSLFDQFIFAIGLIGEFHLVLAKKICHQFILRIVRFMFHRVFGNQVVGWARAPMYKSLPYIKVNYLCMNIQSTCPTLFCTSKLLDKQEGESLKLPYLIISLLLLFPFIQGWQSVCFAFLVACLYAYIDSSVRLLHCLYACFYMCVQLSCWIGECVYFARLLGLNL